MPSDWLQVPHYKQSQEGHCLPACVRMVLAHLGQEMDESRLARLLKTRPFGTQADNVRLLSQLGCTVTFERGTEFDLRHWLERQSPCIVFLKTEALPHWQVEHAHAVVLVGLSSDAAYVNVNDLPSTRPRTPFHSTGFFLPGPNSITSTLSLL